MDTVARNREQQRIEELWKVSVATYQLREKRTSLVAWYLHEQRMEHLHAGLAAEHHRKAARHRAALEEMDRVGERNGHHHGEGGGFSLSPAPPESSRGEK